MTTNTNHTEETLDKAAPQALTDAERVVLWSRVETRIATRVPSPYFSVFSLSTKSMIPLVIAIAVLLGASGTVAASDAARPGDVLFPVDRAIENVRLTLASEKGKADLRIKYAEERLDEFESVVDDELEGDELTGTLTQAEADIFTNETIVKLEAGDRHATFITDAATRANIIAEIVSRYGFVEADVDALLTIETEDRSSRPEDEAVSEEGKLRIENALSVLNTFVLETRGAASTTPQVLAALALLESKLLERSGELPGELRVKVQDDRARIEMRDEDGDKVRVEVKDGEVRVKTDDDSDDEDRDDSSSNDDDSTDAIEIEADVFTDITIVTVEQNDEKKSFSTTANTRAAIVAAILTRYPLLETAAIDAALDLEIEDRASRADDIEDESEDDEDDSDDHSGSSNDDDSDDDSGKDEDHSGSGRGN